MKVIKTRDVDRALRTLDADERQQLLAWFGHLENWENDERLRSAVRPTVVPDTFALDTPYDMRVFFALDEAKREIVIVDLAKPSRFPLARAAE